MFWPPELRNFKFFYLFRPPQNTTFIVFPCFGHKHRNFEMFYLFWPPEDTIFKGFSMFWPREHRKIELFYMFWPQEHTILIVFPCSVHQNIGTLRFVLATRRHDFHRFSMFWPPEHWNFKILYIFWQQEDAIFICFACSGHQNFGIF